MGLSPFHTNLRKRLQLTPTDADLLAAPPPLPPALIPKPRPVRITPSWERTTEPYRNGNTTPAAEGFGRVLREYRERAGISQEKLSSLVLCDRSYIGRLEHASRLPSPGFVERAAVKLNLSPVERQRLWDAAFSDPGAPLRDPRMETISAFLRDPEADERTRMVVEELLVAALVMIERRMG